jgi:Holliday junction DNA helicase RuvA
MIAYLCGTFQSRDITGGPADKIVVDVAGVGFELHVPHRTTVQLGEPGQTITVHTSLSIRETEWLIFGFGTREEKDMFSLLQSVSGVGPKLALALVGAVGPEQIAVAIAQDDVKMLSQAPGVGSKVAQRIILELKSKVEDWQLRSPRTGHDSAKGASVNEARTILEGLGYTLSEINMAFKAAAAEAADDDVELLVRHSLKVLGAAQR